MALLKGINFDISGQTNTKILNYIAASNTTLLVENTTDLEEDDYILLEPYTEYAEIIQITSVEDVNKLEITPVVFNHNKKSNIYKIPYNQMKFYQCDSATGDFTWIETVNMLYKTNFTNYNYSAAVSNYYYKRTFYNSTTDRESDIDFASAWQTNDEELWISEQEIRAFLQFEFNDYPTSEDMRSMIKLAMRRISLDINSTNENILFIATLLLAKSYIMRGLASKSLAKGYIQANVEGRTVTKAYQELILEAENVEQEYKEFIANTARQEAVSTAPMKVDADTKADLIANMMGTTNGEYYQREYRFNYFWRTRK